jgi:nucleoside-diphosphate-sugar epimerase
MVDVLTRAGHDIVGLDSYLRLRLRRRPDGRPRDRKDVRDVTTADLHGFDAIIHLALSNDPLATK